MIDRIGAFFAQRGAWAWPLLIFLLAFAQYANTLGHDYAWDDHIVIQSNPRTQLGLAGIPAHFEVKTREVLADFTGYRPVAMTSFSLDVALAGLNPFVGHLHNVLLFGLLCCLLFWTLEQVAPSWSASKRFWATLIFVVHPLHVEVVANIKSRDEILALLFGLLALNFFLRQCRGGHWAYLLGAGVCATLAALSKENAVLILPVLALAGFLLVEGGLRARLLHGLKAAVPLAVVVGTIYLLTGALPGTPSPVKPVGFWENLSLGNSHAVPMTDYDAFGNSMWLFASYFGEFLLPLSRAYHSGYNQMPPLEGAWVHAGVLVAVIFMFGAVFLAWLPWTRQMGFGLLFYSITVAIYLHLFDLVLSDTRADRFMFTPSVGLCLFLVAMLDRELDKRWPVPKRTKGADESKVLGIPRRAALGVLALLIAVPMSVATWVRNPAWHDSLTLFETDMPKLERCAKAHYYLAEELSAHLDSLPDRPATKARIIQHYEAAIAITPLAYYAFDGLGNFYLRERQPAEAGGVFTRMCAAFPKEADPWYYQGRADYEQARYAQAVEVLARSRGLRPGAPDTWELEALAMVRAGRAGEAQTLLEEAIPLFPQYLTLHAVMAEAYLADGDTTGSYRPLEYLINTEPQNSLWWKRIIGHSQLLHDDKRASYYYQKARELGVEF